MGGFYGSIQVRSEDRERLKAIVERIAGTTGDRFLLGPPIDGWIGIYPGNHGQDERVGQQIANEISDGVLHLIVHDDDIFAYWLYRNGQPVDSFCSSPGYFGEADRPREGKMTGNPQTFRHIIGDSVSRLAPLLARVRVRSVFASETMSEFAKVLKIANAVTAYEYLKEGDRAGIKRWREFEEIPPDDRPSYGQQKRRTKALVNAERKRLKSQGSLLLSDVRKERMVIGCALSDRFVVAWLNSFPDTVTFNEYRSTSETPRTIELQKPSPVRALAGNAARNRIAVGTAGSMRVYDFAGAQWTIVGEIPQQDGAVSVAFSTDGRLIAHLSQKDLCVWEVEGSKKLLAVPMDPVRTFGRHRSAFHPSGEWVAIAGRTLSIISIEEQPTSREFFIGGGYHPSAAVYAYLRPKLTNLSLPDLDRQKREAMEGAKERTAEMVRRSKTPFSSEQIEQMYQQVEKNVEGMNALLVGAKTGRLPDVPPEAVEPAECVGFSGDGRWLWCGTSWGLRVYDWSSIERQTGDDMPPATWRFRLPGEPVYEFSQYVVAVAEETDAAAIVFGGGTGRLYRMSLLTGETREILKLPGECVVTGLAMSADGKTLGVAYGTAVTAAKDARSMWDLWSYPRLRGPFAAKERI